MVVGMIIRPSWWIGCVHFHTACYLAVARGGAERENDVKNFYVHFVPQLREKRASDADPKISRSGVSRLKSTPMPYAPHWPVLAHKQLGKPVSS